jgi:hypothetical protein
MHAQAPRRPEKLGGRLRGSGNIGGNSADSAAAAATAQPVPKFAGTLTLHGVVPAVPTRTALPDTLPPMLRQRLAAAGIKTCQAWVALRRRRREIFGITAAMVVQIDAAVKAVQR